MDFASNGALEIFINLINALVTITFLKKPLNIFLVLENSDLFQKADGIVAILLLLAFLHFKI